MAGYTTELRRRRALLELVDQEGGQLSLDLVPAELLDATCRLIERGTLAHRTRGRTTWLVRPGREE